MAKLAARVAKRDRRVGDFTDTSLSGWVYPIGSAEQSTEGKAMATKIRVSRGNSTGDWNVKGEPKELSKLVNDALKKGDKFVTFTHESGKARSVIAERILLIWEE